MDRPKHIGQMLGCCAHLCRQKMDKIMGDYGVTQAQTHIMIYILRNSDRVITQSDIERDFKIKGSTVNGLITRLEEKGLVKRSQSKSDARCRCVTYTDKGLEMDRILRKSAIENEKRITKGMSEEDIDKMMGYMELIIANLMEENND